MTNRLTETQLARVVAEVTRLEQLREDHQRQTLDRGQVNQILQELNLPTDLLDEAMAQLYRREALAQQRRRKMWIAASIIAALLAILVASSFFISRRNAAFARIAAEPGRITRASDDGGHLQTITRDGQDAVYHVVLREAPLGERLDLSCNWIDPSGRIFHQNRYQTRPTDKSVWPTACRCQIGTAAAKGAWRVEMSLGNRVVSATTFQVE
jgi:hypothetical protein